MVAGTSNVLRVTLAPLRRTAVAVLLVACLAPPARAATVVCDTRQVETLTVRLGAAPAKLAAGTPLDLQITVVRGAGTPVELGAAGVEVLVGLTWPSRGAYDRKLSDGAGRVRARVLVPREARGRATLDVEVFRSLVSAPCLQVEEHGRTTVAWGSAS